MSIIQRVMVTVSSPCVTSNGASSDGVVADAAGMHVGLVRQVHQIVDHQPVVAFEREWSCPRRSIRRRRSSASRAPAPGSASAGSPGQSQTRRCRSTTGIGAHAGRRIDRLLRRHERASARRIEHQAVVAAHDLIADQPAHRQRQQPMPAGVLERGDRAVGRRYSTTCLPHPPVFSYVYRIPGTRVNNPDDNQAVSPIFPPRRLIFVYRIELATPTPAETGASRRRPCREFIHGAAARLLLPRPFC